MGLSEELVSQFVKVTNDDNDKPKENMVYGTIRFVDGKTYVKLDGADNDVLTPVDTTVDVKEEDRVTVLIKNHTATVTGNTTAPAAQKKDLDALSGELGDVVARSVTTEYLKANYASIGDLQADRAEIDELIAKKADITELEADRAEIDELIAKKADIESLENNYANIDFANVGEADMKKIYAKFGFLEDVTVENGAFTGELVAVKISGDLIETGTLKTDRLIIKGTDGKYYALNTDFTGIPNVEPVEEDAIHGSVMIAESITADKISVSDLKAFGATIGGFTIDDDSINAYVKDSAGNTTRGFYVDNDGQMNLGDSSNYIKYFKDTDGKYKLKIAADRITFKINNTDTDIGTAVENAVDAAEAAEAAAGKAINTADDAAKTATNWMDLDDEDGLVVGNRTGDALKGNVRIDTDSVDIRNGDTVLSSFGINEIELGKNEDFTAIKMCGDQGRIYASGENGYYNGIRIDSKEDFRAYGNQIYLGTFLPGYDDGYGGDNSDPLYSQFQMTKTASSTRFDLATHIYKDRNTYGIGENNCAQIVGEVRGGVEDESGEFVSGNTVLGMQVSHYDSIKNWSRGSSIQLNSNGTILMTDSHTGDKGIELKVNGYLTVRRDIILTGTEYDCYIHDYNTELWTHGDGIAMVDDDEIWFEEYVSNQLSGIVLVFRHTDVTGDNSFFIPKGHIEYHGSLYYIAPCHIPGSNTVRTKTLIISNDGIIGHSNNSSSSTCKLYRVYGV